jgi:hypothetical protein
MHSYDFTTTNSYTLGMCRISGLRHGSELQVSLLSIILAIVLSLGVAEFNPMDTLISEIDYFIALCG